jgi:glycopeptide antibiotics resistance protein
VAEPVVRWIPAGDSEQVLNTLLFVPLGATIALLLSRRLWPIAILAGFALSASVEYAQASIPGRVPDPADVLWNTVGGAIGVVLVSVPRLIGAAVQRARLGSRDDVDARVSAGV